VQAQQRIGSGEARGHHLNFRADLIRDSIVRIPDSQSPSIRGYEVHRMGPVASGFTPRAPRFDLKVPVVLYLGDRIASGHSINVSESGMLAMFDRPVEAWLTGQLSSVAGEWHLSIDVRVVRAEGRTAALVFKIVSEGDRATIQKLIDHADPGSADRPLAPAS
jgi:hypothetical protein